MLSRGSSKRAARRSSTYSERHIAPRFRFVSNGRRGRKLAPGPAWTLQLPTRMGTSRLTVISSRQGARRPPSRPVPPTPHEWGTGAFASHDSPPVPACACHPPDRRSPGNVLVPAQGVRGRAPPCRAAPDLCSRQETPRRGRRCLAPSQSPRISDILKGRSTSHSRAGRTSGIGCRELVPARRSGQGAPRG
jgi:hypothetical protein